MGLSNDTARLQLLYELGNAFAARLELGDLLPLVVDKCREVLAAEVLDCKQLGYVVRKR